MSTMHLKDSLQLYILMFWMIGCCYIAYQSQFPDYYWIHYIANGQAHPYPMGGVIIISIIFSICLAFYYMIISPVTFYQVWLKRYLMSAIYLFLMGLAMLFLYPLHTPNFISAGMMILVYGSFFQILGSPSSIYWLKISVKSSDANNFNTPIRVKLSISNFVHAPAKFIHKVI